MTRQYNNSIIYITIFAVLISLLIGCGEDDDPKIITPDYLPIEVGNYWTFIEPDYPEDPGTISITGTTLLSNGKTVFIAAATDEYGSDDSGYLSQAASDLLLFHKTLNDLQGELIYSPPIKVGTTWQGQQGEAEVVAQETVNTPAGVFQNCFRVNVRVHDDYDDVYYSIWLAKNVGPVKLVVIDTFDGQIETAIVLKRFHTKESTVEGQEPLMF